jgi:hypothetical protein
VRAHTRTTHTQHTHTHMYTSPPPPLQLDRPIRTKALRERLGGVKVPEAAYLPLCKSTDPWQRILSIIPDEARAFSTKARCPCLVLFEVERELVSQSVSRRPAQHTHARRHKLQHARLMFPSATAHSPRLRPHRGTPSLTTPTPTSPAPPCPTDPGRGQLPPPALRRAGRRDAPVGAPGPRDPHRRGGGGAGPPHRRAW